MSKQAMKKILKGGDRIPESDFIAKSEAILRENWEHSRHCENLLLWFTNIYAIVMAAILVFIGERYDTLNENFAPVLLLSVFGLILSVIGFSMVVAFSLGHKNYIMNIVTILYTWNMKEFYKDWEKPFHFKRVHRWFFEATFALFFILCVMLSLRYVFQGSVTFEELLFRYPIVSVIPGKVLFRYPTFLVIPAFFIVLGFVEELYQWKLEGEFKARREFIRMLHEGFQTKLNSDEAAEAEVEKVVKLKILMEMKDLVEQMKVYLS